jgi:hypothetical protein
MKSAAPPVLAILFDTASTRASRSSLTSITAPIGADGKFLVSEGLAVKVLLNSKACPFQMMRRSSQPFEESSNWQIGRASRNSLAMRKSGAPPSVIFLPVFLP